MEIKLVSSTLETIHCSLVDKMTPASPPDGGKRPGSPEALMRSLFPVSWETGSLLTKGSPYVVKATQIFLSCWQKQKETC